MKESGSLDVNRVTVNGTSDQRDVKKAAGPSVCTESGLRGTYLDVSERSVVEFTTVFRKLRNCGKFI